MNTAIRNGWIVARQQGSGRYSLYVPGQEPTVETAATDHPFTPPANSLGGLLPPSDMQFTAEGGYSAEPSAN